MDNSTPAGWWLSVSSGGTLSGTATTGETIYSKITATYTNNSITYTSSGIYKITVTNNAPTVSISIPDQSVTVNTAFSFGKNIRLYLHAIFYMMKIISKYLYRFFNNSF